MEAGFQKDGREETSCPQLLDLMSKQREWMVRDGGGGGGNGYGVAEDKQLELKLGPPVQEDSSSILSFGFFTKSSKSTINLSSGAKRGFFDTLEAGSDDYQKQQQQQKSGFLHFQKKTDGGDKEKQEVIYERKTPPATASGGNAPATHNSNQSRTTTAPVVGWPPIRSFRKNIASSSSKPSSKDDVLETTQKPEKCTKGIFVKVNMDGIPIGRKVNLKAYDNYENLSSVVDQLFRGLLAAQGESPAVGADNSAEDSPSITRLLDGKGEYTLVYEDNDGDRMLVGDVPWEMFVSTARRLRVLKTSELSIFVSQSK